MSNAADREREREVQQNLSHYIHHARFNLVALGADLAWDADAWPQAKVTFGNLDQKTRLLDVSKLMVEPFRSFAKAYFRTRRSENPVVGTTDLQALKCLERALTKQGLSCISAARHATFDVARDVACEHYTPAVAYRVGGYLEGIANHITEENLVLTAIHWRNSVKRPGDTNRTGDKAKAERDKKLPSDDVLNAIADIFAKSPTHSRDIFTTCTCALHLSAPCRISEVLGLHVNCEVEERRRSGETSYGWRFIPAKGGPPQVKWVPDPMVSVAKEAMGRLRGDTDAARSLAAWLEDHPDQIYRHAMCPDKGEDEPLSHEEALAAVGTTIEGHKGSELRRLGFDPAAVITLRMINAWAHARLPKGFPWFDKKRGIKWRDALYCQLQQQLRTDFRARPLLLGRPDNNTLTIDLGAEAISKSGEPRTSLFDRWNIRASSGDRLRATSHQFRHLLNTMAQRGGLAQGEIARWSGRANLTQNRDYDHLSEFELVDKLRTATQAAEQKACVKAVAKRIPVMLPVTRQEFNAREVTAAHVTELGFCIHDFVMAPCPRVRDCKGCEEQVCVKGDRRLDAIPFLLDKTTQLLARAKEGEAAGHVGADRWVETQTRAETQLSGLMAILRDDTIPDGSLIRLASPAQYSAIGNALRTQGKHVSQERTKRQLKELPDG